MTSPFLTNLSHPFSLRSHAFALGLMASVVGGAGPAGANEAVLACLDAPSQDCALQAAVQTAITEELALEKANILIGVADALIGLGQTSQGLQALGLAMDEVRLSNLSLVTQEKIRSIAPLRAQGGDIAGALALVDEIQITSVKDQLLEQIAIGAIAKGDLASATVALDQIASTARAFWRRLDLYLQAPDDLLTAVDLLPFVEKIEAEARAERRYQGLITLGLIEKRRGNDAQGDALLAGADALFDTVLSAQARAAMASTKIQAVHKADLGTELLEAAFTTTRFSRSAVGRDGLMSYALRVGPIEAKTGRLASALRRVDDFVDPETKARYLGSLVIGAPDPALTTAIDAVLAEFETLESAFERDSLRLKLLRGAIGAKDTDLALRLVSDMEDEETQAIGLALTAVIL